MQHRQAAGRVGEPALDPHLLTPQGLQPAAVTSERHSAWAALQQRRASASPSQRRAMVGGVLLAVVLLVLLSVDSPGSGGAAGGGAVAAGPISGSRGASRPLRARRRVGRSSSGRRGRRAVLEEEELTERDEEEGGAGDELTEPYEEVEPAQAAADFDGEPPAAVPLDEEEDDGEEGEVDRPVPPPPVGADEYSAQKPAPAIEAPAPPPPPAPAPPARPRPQQVPPDDGSPPEVLEKLIKATAGVQPGAVVPNCPTVMTRLRDSRPATVWPPPCPLPRVDEFTAHGLPLKNPNKPYCLEQRYDGHTTLTWTEADVEDKRRKIAARTWCGSYNCEEVDNVDAALRAHEPEIRGRRGLVLGSERPWIEALLLNLGAEEVWTMEYSTIVSSHPRLQAHQYTDIASRWLAGSLPPFDFIVTFSSIEHSGLGRYGGETTAWGVDWVQGGAPGREKEDGAHAHGHAMEATHPPYHHPYPHPLPHMRRRRAQPGRRRRGAAAGVVHAAPGRPDVAGPAAHVRRGGLHRGQRAPLLRLRAPAVRHGRVQPGGLRGRRLRGHQRAQPAPDRHVPQARGVKNRHALYTQTHTLIPRHSYHNSGCRSSRQPGRHTVSR
jgi:hypothetical protein